MAENLTRWATVSFTRSLFHGFSYHELQSAVQNEMYLWCDDRRMQYFYFLTNWTGLGGVWIKVSMRPEFCRAPSSSSRMSGYQGVCVWGGGGGTHAEVSELLPTSRAEPAYKAEVRVIAALSRKLIVCSDRPLSVLKVELHLKGDTVPRNRTFRSLICNPTGRPWTACRLFKSHTNCFETCCEIRLRYGN
jgi:hypothetical protein